MLWRKFLEKQTVISGETRFLRTVYGAILGLMRLKCLSVGLSGSCRGHPSTATGATTPKVVRCVREQAMCRWLHRFLGRFQKSIPLDWQSESPSIGRHAGRWFLILSSQRRSAPAQEPDNTARACACNSDVAAATTRPSEATVSGAPCQSVMQPPAPSTRQTSAM
jgi:hypothetical protein